jgi:hypothetical protein
MHKSSKLNWRLRLGALPIHIRKICKKIGHSIWLLPILYFFYSTLWIGKPNQITCQNIDLIRVDCTLRYQGILRSSEQKVKNVQDVDIDIRTSFTEEGTTTTYYVAVFRSDSGVTDIKTYFERHNPELQLLNERIKYFLKSNAAKIVVPIQYDPWQPIFNCILSLIFLCIFLIFSIPVITFIVLLFGAIAKIFT